MRRIASYMVAITCCSLFSCSDDSLSVDPAAPRVPASFLVLADGSGDFATIQDAINSVVDGDTIELGNGTYRGSGNRDIEFLGKAVVVRSASGDPDSCIVDAENTPADRHRGFWFRSGEGPGSVLDGVTVINGGGIGGGGGVSCDRASPHLINLVLRNNEDGGILVRLASPTIERCLFEENPEGGLDIRSSRPVVRDCAFVRNLEGAIGSFSSSPTLERCTFIENQGNFGGAIQAGGDPDSSRITSIRDCVFVGNQAARRGGAVLFAVSGEVVSCIIVDNSAGESGGAIVASGPNVEVTVSATTIVGNGAPTASGVFVAAGADIVIEQSIIAFGTGGSAVDCDTTGSAVYGPTEVMISCSDVFGNEGGDWVGCIQAMKSTDGNICADPLFCSLSNRELSLTPGSPCYTAPCGLMGALSAGCSDP